MTLFVTKYLHCSVFQLALRESWSIQSKLGSYFARFFKIAQHSVRGAELWHFEQTPAVNYYPDSETRINPLHVSSVLQRVIFKINRTLNTYFVILIDLWRLYSFNMGLSFRCHVLLDV